MRSWKLPKITRRRKSSNSKNQKKKNKTIQSLLMTSWENLQPSISLFSPYPHWNQQKKALNGKSIFYKRIQWGWYYSLPCQTLYLSRINVHFSNFRLKLLFFFCFYCSLPEQITNLFILFFQFLVFVFLANEVGGRNKKLVFMLNINNNNFSHAR